jgi:hypothetical protein
MKRSTTAVLTLWLLSWTCGAAAAEIIPAERLADWKPGVSVGVPGGIPANRTHLLDVTKAPYKADNTGKTDAQPAIMQAVAQAAENDVVYLPAGTYRIDKPIGLGGKRITLRGAGPDKTILMAYNATYSALNLGDSGGADWQWAQPNAAITGSPSKGATVLGIADMKLLGDKPVGALCQISLKNDRQLPVISHSNWDRLRRQKCRIVAKTATSVTIFPPLLFDLPAALEPTLNMAAKHAEFSGIEDLTIDGTNAKAPHGLVGLNQCYGCWVKNVTVRNAERYLFSVSDSLECEIRHCFIGKRKAPFGPNGGGLLFGASTACLVEDNILAETFPHMEIDASSGNVFAYNFCDDGGVHGGLLGCTINGNHGPHSSFNLYEGNVAPKFQCDGYHGSGSHDTLFRNWLHGTSTKSDQFWICINLNRFTRCYNIVGNVLGRKGYTWLYDNAENGFGYGQHFIYSFGMPNMGNGGFSGKAQPSKGKYWADWNTLLASERGKGPGAGGFQELDLDVKATTLLKGNYNFKDNAVSESESLGAAKLPKSLYRTEKPAWFGNLSWPAFGPDTDFEKNKIPAQVRYEAMK